MSPLEIAAIQAGIALLQAAIQNAPALQADLQALFSNSNLTSADLEAFIAKVSSETYGQFVPLSVLPPSETGDSPAAPPTTTGSTPPAPSVEPPAAPLTPP